MITSICPYERVKPLRRAKTSSSIRNCSPLFSATINVRGSPPEGRNLNSRMSNGEQVSRLTGRVLSAKPAGDFGEYPQWRIGAAN